MNTKGKWQEGSISILEAVETLSEIADLEILPEVGVAEKHHITLNNNTISYRSIQWMHPNDIEERLIHLKEIFQVVLTYLKGYYKKRYFQLADQQSIEGVKNIMLLVGEAAKKLDRFTTLFKLSTKNHVIESKEYKQLQDFYRQRIAKQIDESVLSKWIYGLASRAFISEASTREIKKGLDTKHIFVDLEGVKKDAEYELFLMRKEDGTRFYNPRLIRNIKLICDFGEDTEEKMIDSPLRDLYVWNDRFLHTCAKDLYEIYQPHIKAFYEIGIKHKDKELVEAIRNAIMALLLSSHSKNLIKNSPVKSCFEYFNDFQYYLNSALLSREYQRLLAYPPDSDDKTARCLLETLQAFCVGFFKYMKGYQEMRLPIQKLIKEAHQDISIEHLDAVKSSHQLWNRLACDYRAFTKLLKHHSSGPLVKILNLLESEDSELSYDPILQNNIPSQLYSIYYNETKIDCIHLPCPIHQYTIDKASIKEEFKAFIQGLNEGEKHLVINFQDRTSWREQARCKVLEELQQQEEFKNKLLVVTLPKDTEFYHQMSPYQQEKHSDIFVKTLLDHIFKEDFGFFFPENMKAELKSFMNDLAKTVLRIFFHNKNVLLQEHRMDFIEIFYVFLELKLIELIKPSSFSFTCKDSLDIGSPSTALLFSLLKLLNENQLTDQEMDYIDVLLFAPSIVVRERLISPERFKRFLSALRSFESIREEYGAANFLMIIREAFGRLYKNNILESMVIIPPGGSS